MATATTPFQSFFNQWLDRQETLLSQLLHALSPEKSEDRDHLTALIDRSFSHYRSYYHEKSTAASRDGPCLFLSPLWLTSFERSLLWLGEFRPSTVFTLLRRAVPDLTPDQIRTIEAVRADTRREERMLTEAMAAIQESIASPAMLGLVRRTANQIDGERGQVDEAMDSINAAMLSVMLSADSLRGVTVAGMVEALSPVQTVTFLVAAAQFQLSVRRWGRQRDDQRVAH